MCPPEVRGAEVVRVISLGVALAAGGQRPLARAVLRRPAVSGATHVSRVTCQAEAKLVLEKVPSEGS